MSESIKVFVPRDATALSLGADKVAQAIVAEAAARGIRPIWPGGKFFAEAMVSAQPGRMTR